MYSTAMQTRLSYPIFPARTRPSPSATPVEATMAANWNSLRAQLMLQWQRLSRKDLDAAGPDRHAIALLIQNQYGIAAELVETYLANLEKTINMPLLAA